MTSTKIDDKDILNLAKRTAGQNSDDILAFDITFTDKDGNEKQPNSYVKVSINPKDYNLDAERYALVHIDGEKNAKYLGNIAVSNGLLTFYANSFSIYAIIPTTQTDQQRYARNTYEFYVNDELVASQIVRNGDILNAPAAPSLECLIFMGWYTESDRLFNGLNLAVNIPDGTTADKTIKLHAKFADKIYSVLFFNPQGNVLATKTGTNGDNINTDDIRHEVSAGHFVDAWTTDASILDRYAGCGNECEIPDDEVIPNQITGDITIDNDNIKLYPIIRAVKWAHFHQNDDDNDNHTEASYTASTYAFYGHTINRPTNPTRNGYDFVGWATDEQGTNMFNFNTPLTSDIELYAIWRPHTNTQYRIIFWKEALDNGHYVAGNYEYASYVDATGTSVATNTVEGTITLDTNKTRTSSGSATLAVKIMGYATVHYYVEGTTTKVKADDNLSGLVGDTFSVEIPEIEGYEIVKVEVRAAAVNTYTFKDQAQEIVISYRALPEPEPEPEPEEPVNPSTASDVNLIPVFGVFTGVAVGLFAILRRRRI